jgi:hypothetical protein
MTRNGLLGNSWAKPLAAMKLTANANAENSTQRDFTASPLGWREMRIGVRLSLNKARVHNETLTVG